jgi:hypothetical protein
MLAQPHATISEMEIQRRNHTPSVSPVGASLTFSAVHRVWKRCGATQLLVHRVWMSKGRTLAPRNGESMIRGQECKRR